MIKTATQPVVAKAARSCAEQAKLDTLSVITGNGPRFISELAEIEADIAKRLADLAPLEEKRDELKAALEQVELAKLEAADIKTRN